MADKKTTSSVQDIVSDKPAFGSRYLTESQDVWSQNAWDHVPPPTDQAEAIAKSLSRQQAAPVPLEDKQKYNETPARHWDNFYKMNADNFFKDRKWLHTEFPELAKVTQRDAGPLVVTEVGCGAGNSVFPLLSNNENPELRLHAYDYSNHAVKVVQNSPLYLSPPIGRITASVWDLTSKDGPPPDLAPGSVDIVIMVFVFSALHPDEWGRAIRNVHTILKPNGLVLFRDYGRYDMAQLRFKGGRLLDDNFYIRGDKTRVYFFELDELSLLFTGSRTPSSQHLTNTTSTQVEDEDTSVTPKPSTPEQHTPTTEPSSSPLAEPDAAGPFPTPATPETETTTSPPSTAAVPPSIIHPNLLSPLVDCPPHPLFSIEQLGVDRRLIVNRKRQLKMYRVWMQGKFRKL